MDFSLYAHKFLPCNEKHAVFDRLIPFFSLFSYGFSLIFVLFGVILHTTRTERRKPMKRTKSLISLLVLLFVLCSSLSLGAFGAEATATLTLKNGRKLALRQFDGEWYVSLYALSLALDGSGSFNGTTLTVTAFCEGKTISAASGQTRIVSDGESISGKKNRISSNVLYVPLSSAAKALSYTLKKGETSFFFEKNEGQSLPKLDEDCVLWLARIIYCESRGQPYEGQLAVGTVVMNRVASEDFPNTIYSVIFDTKYGVQFTPAATGAVWCTPDDTALKAARQVLGGYRTDEHILYFMNASIAASKWISNNRPYAFTIADHSFFY